MEVIRRNGHTVNFEGIKIKSKESEWNINSANDLVKFPSINFSKSLNSRSKPKKKRVGKSRKTVKANGRSRVLIEVDIDKEMMQEIISKKAFHSKSTHRERLKETNPIAINNQIVAGAQRLNEQLSVDGILNKDSGSMTNLMNIKQAELTNIKLNQNKFSSPKLKKSNAKLSTISTDHAKSVQLPSDIDMTLTPESIKRLRNKFYDETMGKRKQEIIKNMKKRVSKCKHTNTTQNLTVELKFPTLTNRSIKDGFSNDTHMNSFNTAKAIKGLHKGLNIIKEEKFRNSSPHLKHKHVAKHSRDILNTIQDKISELDSDSDQYESEKFSDEDIFDTTHSEIDKSKHNSIEIEERTKNYSAYIEEVEKKQILPRRMGFQSK